MGKSYFVYIWIKIFCNGLNIVYFYFRALVQLEIYKPPMQNNEVGGGWRTTAWKFNKVEYRL
jgi:hypothetical protein